MIYSNKPMTELLKIWEHNGTLTPLDRHFALEMARMHNIDSPLFLFICALLSKQLSNQHSCLALHHLDYGNPMEESPRLCNLNCSDVELIEELLHFPAISLYQDGQPCHTPIVIEGTRLYLQRYHQFELQVAATLTKLSQNKFELDNVKIAKELEIVFPKLDDKVDWQKVAAATALTRKLSVITGGPGTGKTTTVTKLLYVMQLHNDLNIKLVAPTGKAAARLTESIKASKVRLRDHLLPYQNDIDISAVDRIPEDASTIHRLLGVIPNSNTFRHNKDNPLRLDLLIIDEASMVDLPMMHKVLSALPSNARLILLGDQDQLASVEAGAVLADICAGLAEENFANDPMSMRYSKQQAQVLSELTQTDLSQFIDENSRFGDSLCMLRHSHRFKGDAGIGKLAEAVNHGVINDILGIWQKQYDELSWLGHGVISANLQENIGLVTLINQSVEYYRPYLQMIEQLSVAYSVGMNDGDQTAIEVIDKFNEYRLLCATRSGHYGVEGINKQIADILTKRKLIDAKQEFYLGRPIIIQANDYNLGLFNGDIGIILQDSAKPDRLMAHFVQADGSVLKVLPARLPTHETCFAMTVHKSQGSEFDRVAFVMQPKPTPAQWQLLTKELLYTAVTRAKSHFVCLGTRQVFEHCSGNPTKRASGLAEKLW
ncbi:exodeoxyribonuclease V subunit alpha [Shewanella sp. OPT22]|nr:exodeoxyribonuclease V subunit alpha [Shewanella sp. OPT22]